MRLVRRFVGAVGSGLGLAGYRLAETGALMVRKAIAPTRVANPARASIEPATVIRIVRRDP